MQRFICARPAPSGAEVTVVLLNGGTRPRREVPLTILCHLLEVQDVGGINQ
jgi:hypothetical protein